MKLPSSQIEFELLRLIVGTLRMFFYASFFFPPGDSKVSLSSEEKVSWQLTEQELRRRMRRYPLLVDRSKVKPALVGSDMDKISARLDMIEEKFLKMAAGEDVQRVVEETT